MARWEPAVNPLPFQKTDVFFFAVLIFIVLSLPLAAGLYVDSRQGSWPVWTVAGVVAGCVISISLVCYRIVKRLNAYGLDHNIDVVSAEQTATYSNEEEPAQCQNC
jgi:hypothetical protein